MVRCLLILSIGLVSSAQAQVPAVVQTTTYTSSLQATSSIWLQDGYSAPDGYEARIVYPEAVAGRWSLPQPWTTFVRGGSSPDGMVGIHTHLLPNGRVLSWEGHNDNEVDSVHRMSHVYA
ncbi:hypothetical protein [Hymenobacter algoricola]